MTDKRNTISRVSVNVSYNYTTASINISAFKTYAVSIKLKEPAFRAGGLIIEAGGFCYFWRQQIRGLIRTGNAEHIFKIIKR